MKKGGRATVKKLLTDYLEGSSTGGCWQSGQWHGWDGCGRRSCRPRGKRRWRHSMSPPEEPEPW